MSADKFATLPGLKLQIALHVSWLHNRLLHPVPVEDAIDLVARDWCLDTTSIGACLNEYQRSLMQNAVPFLVDQTNSPSSSISS